MGKELRKLGVGVFGEVPWGTHICQFYQTKEDLIDILVPYFKTGLENNEFCMWVTAEPLKAEDAKRSLKKVVKNLDSYIKKGQIEILDANKWYTKRGRFDSDKVLKGWVKKEKQALKNGFDGLRLTGDTFWLERKDWKDFIEYEGMLNNVIGKHQMIAVCSYSLGKCGSLEIIDVVNNHQSSLIRRHKKWRLIENSEYTQAKEEMEQSRRELTIKNQITNIFLTTPNDEMYGEVLEIILEVMESRYGFFGYIDEDGALVCPSMNRDVWEQCQIPDKEIVFPREKWGGIWGRALMEKKILYSNVTFRVPQGHIPMHRALDVPIIHQREVIGNLLVANKKTNYDEKDKGLLETISKYIAPVLHARLERDRQDRKRNRAEKVLLERTHDLGERVKELNCLYGISKLLEKKRLTLEEMLQGTVNLIPTSWHYPEVTCTRIVLEGKTYETNNFKETVWKQACDIIVHGDRIGTLEVCYLEERPEIDEGPFLKEEKSLIDAIAERLGMIIEFKVAEEQLKIKKIELEETNTALRVLLKVRDADRVTIEEKVLLNVNKLVFPYLERLKKSSLDANQENYVSILEANLKEITSPFSHKLSSKYLSLTPREIQVVNFIKGGKGNKEIAQLLNLSSRTIDSYREHIRRRMGIKNRKVNLRTYLLSLQ